MVVVGVCASGKNTLAAGLTNLGYNVRSFAQEHSVTEKVWQRLGPDFLIYLSCSLETIEKRKDVKWRVGRYERQLNVLKHAKKHADLIVVTDDFTPEQLVDYVARKLKTIGLL